MGRSGADDQAFGLHLAGPGVVVPYAGGCGSNVATLDGVMANMSPGAWHHLAFAYDTNSKKFQLTFDGADVPLLDHPTCASMLDTTPGIFTLGGSQNLDTGAWIGLIDEVRVWSISRPVADIAQLAFGWPILVTTMP
jgi:Concanavalin A-like lectin/glucanases superfamily